MPPFVLNGGAAISATAADGVSLAKTVTAALVWRVIDEGQIALNDPVQAHVAEFPYADVTHVLSHTSGQDRQFLASLP